MEENLERNLHKIVLRAGTMTDWKTILSLKGTKAIKLEDMSNTDEEYNNRESWGDLLLSAHDRPMSAIDVTTWSSLIRNAIYVLQPQIDYVAHLSGSEIFRATYEICLDMILNNMDGRPNSNFPRKLFTEAEETDLIHSTVYLSNKNHLLKIFEDENNISWYACAVYTGEIIWVIQALLDTIYTLSQSDTTDISHVPHHTLVLTYIDRVDLLDSYHSVEDIPLVGGAELHRFNNNAGVPYSAIYVGDTEMLSCERDDEDSMIEYWNKYNADTKSGNDINKELNRLEMSKKILQIQGKVAKIHSIAMEIYNDIENIQNKYNLATLDDILKSSK